MFQFFQILKVDVKISDMTSWKNIIHLRQRNIKTTQGQSMRGNARRGSA